MINLDRFKNVEAGCPRNEGNLIVGRLPCPFLATHQIVGLWGTRATLWT
jgi:hypothetical protein